MSQIYGMESPINMNSVGLTHGHD